MFGQEITAIRKELLNLKQQKERSLSQLKTVETRIPLVFESEAQTISIFYSPTNDVKPLVSWYLDIDQVDSAWLFVSNNFVNFDQPPDFRYNGELDLRISGLSAPLSVDLVFTSTSYLDYSISKTGA